MNINFGWIKKLKANWFIECYNKERQRNNSGYTIRYIGEFPTDGDPKHFYLFYLEKKPLVRSVLKDLLTKVKVSDGDPPCMYTGLTKEQYEYYVINALRRLK